MPSEIFQVDAFAEGPFSGNPAAVMLLVDFPDDRKMQWIAAEMNQPETAFVVARENFFGLRWFTPTVEVDLCGHATLAAAHILWETGRLPRTADAIFETRSGRLFARKKAAGIELIFPTLPTRESNPPSGLIECLGVRPAFVGTSKFDYLVQVASAADVRNARVDYRKLATVDTRGVILTAVSDDPRFDIVSRFFAPGSGIDEDPATGSAHCVLGAYWRPIIGKSTIRAFQASPRGGTLTVHVDGETTRLEGAAFTIFRGEFLIDP